MYQVYSIFLIVAEAQVVIDDDIAKLVFGSFLRPQNADLTWSLPHPQEMALMAIFPFCKAFPLSLEVLDCSLFLPCYLGSYL
jgi:hypothetical protein